MERKLIMEGKATVGDLMMLHELGYEFVIEDGVITHVYKD